MQVMDQRAAFLTQKRKDFDEFILHHRVSGQKYDREDFKVFIYKIPAELDWQQHNQYLVTNDIYKEDYGTFWLLNKFFEENYSTPEVTGADYVLFPFNLYFYDPLQAGYFRDIAAQMRRVAAGRPIIMYSIGDFCFKRIKRSTRFESDFFKNVQDLQKIVPDWISDKDVFICFESTIDFVFDDVPIFPLVQIAPVQPASGKRDLLFSFCGETIKEGWPEGFVRSPSMKSAWDFLRSENSGTAVIGNIRELQARFGGNPFYDLPKRSLFTLCPRGISCWSFRVFEAILSGSIPIILSDSYMKPFPDLIPWDLFSITVPENSLADAAKIVKALTPEVVQSLTKNLARYQKMFTAPGLFSLVGKTLYNRLARYS